jgi:hypothetical protein
LSSDTCFPTTLSLGLRAILLNAQPCVIISSMRLLRCQEDGKFELTHFGEKTEIPNYAILSHTWLSDTTEITYNDLVAGHLEDKRASYNKLRFCAEQTVADGLQYFWVDTCCINQADSSELQEAIMSMFRWYRAASKCYVYLSDVSAADGTPSTPDSEHDNQPWWEPAFRNSRWFTRGWTLQELLAPHAVDFFSREGSRLGDKTSLDRTLHEITGIPLHILRGEELPFVDKSLVSAAGRRKKDCEDTAYCVHGVYDVDMTRMYGKGENTPAKLRELEDKTTWAHTAAETDRSFETRNRIQKSSRWLAVDAMLGLSQVFVAIPIVMYFPLRDVSSLEAPTVNFVRSHIRGLTNIVQHVSCTTRTR